MADVATRRQPTPGEVDPAYTEQAGWIRRWLDGDSSGHLLVADPAPVVFALDVEPMPPDLRRPVLTRHKVAGPAPWTGRPFVYMWYVAEDELGRMVASGETQIRYLPEPSVICTTLFDDSVWCVRGGEWVGPEGDTCWVVDDEGVVCAEHVTDEERARAVPPR